MNFFEIMNRCLIELNFRPEDSFSKMVTGDHLKLKAIINMVNKELCLTEDWWFRERMTEEYLFSERIEHDNTINGKISSIVYNDETLQYEPNCQLLYQGKTAKNVYSMLNSKFLTPYFLHDREVKVFYFTNNFAESDSGNGKEEMVEETDRSIIPDTFAEQILIYGSCMKFKAMSSYPKFKHWNAQYIKALKDLRTQGMRSKGESPYITIKSR